MTADTTDRPVTAHDTLTVLRFLAGGRDIRFAAQAAQLSRLQVTEIANANGYPDLRQLEWAADLQQKHMDEDAQRYPEGTPRPLRERVATPHVSRHPAPVPRPAGGPTQPARPAPPPSASPPVIVEEDRVTVLVNNLIPLGLKSDKARTRALTKKILDLAGDLQERLKDDTADQERVEREAKERQAAQAEVRALEKKLAAAKAKVAGIGKKRSSSSTDGAMAGRHGHQREVLERWDVTLDDIRRWAGLNGHEVADVGMLPRKVLDAYAADREQA